MLYIINVIAKHMDDNAWWWWYIFRMNGAKYESKHELQIPLLSSVDSLGI